jgi:alpha-2-macroglobulin
VGHYPDIFILTCKTQSWESIVADSTPYYKSDWARQARFGKALALARKGDFRAVEVTLGDGKDYRDRTHKLALPLKEEGAYLVVCRGDDLHASGLVLVSPLKVEVEEDATSGRVRTTVKDVVNDKYLNDVQVKVIGSNNSDFVSGATDLRGVFVADGIRGSSTVIAQMALSG